MKSTSSLRKHRRQRKKTQETLALEANVAHGTISRIERQVSRKIDKNIATRICKALGVKLSDVAEFAHLTET